MEKRIPPKPKPKNVNKIPRNLKSKQAINPLSRKPHAPKRHPLGSFSRLMM
jgi:hypothetical protein